MGLPELDFLLADAEEATWASIAPELTVALGLGYLLYKSLFQERDTNVSLREAGSVLQDLPAISDGRRWHPETSSQPGLGWLVDGTPVHRVVPLDDLLLPRPGTDRVRTRAQPRPVYGRANSRVYEYAQVSPRLAADCVRRARRRQALFAHGRLSSHARRRPRPGSYSCYGY